MTLADLIDLEVQLARDRESDRADLAARDKALLAGAGGPRSRQALLQRWLERLRGPGAGEGGGGGGPRGGASRIQGARWKRRCVACVPCWCSSASCWAGARPR